MVGVDAKVVGVGEDVVEQRGVGLGVLARQDLRVLVLVDTDDDDVGLLLGVVGGARRAGEEAVEHDERGQAPVKRLGHKHGPFGWTRFSDRSAARIRVVSEERENGNDPWHAPALVILTDIANQSTQIQPPIEGVGADPDSGAPGALETIYRFAEKDACVP